MSRIHDLFSKELNVITAGIEFVANDLKEQGATVSQLDWTPPARGNMELVAILDRLEQPEIKEKIEAANREAVERITQSQPFLIGFDQAINVVPGMTKKTILHAGPPITWDKMSGPMKGGIAGALVFEGLADNLEEAEELAASGEITFSPCHEHQSVGSMAGITSASMYMHIVENKTYGNIAYTNLSEQLSKVLRMGANDQTVIDRLVWMRDVLGPILRDAMKLNPKGIDLRLLLSQSLHMGDECHNRNIAGTTLLIQALSPYIVMTDYPLEQKKEVFDFVASSDYFSGPTWMALAKCALDAAHGIENSTIVTTMARNGVEFGIRVSGMAGNTWFTGPSQKVIGPMFAGYKPEDSGLDIGDSAITETYGFGGFAMAAAPAIVPLVGGTVEEAIRYSKDMLTITTAENPSVTIPVLDFMGIPTGIDVRKVLETGTLPIINTAIAHKDAGIGMIGAGITHPPYEAFEKALLAIGEKINEEV
ncbi:oxamate carbamoyltransferase subunit AllG family protein [Jeotgalibaca sp. A127]|uniref:oxamate carbamoyltransferase subunit AllG family protein n=1 Tax=Jeotgalibaca sp. A127 TaxID=3457324 RepID=UPI003FD5DEF1